MPLVARKVVLSFFAITKYKMSWYTWLEKHLLHQQYATNPYFAHVAMFIKQILVQPVVPATRSQQVKTTEEKYFYATSGPTVQTALLTSK
jgi:hypothetical protein